jgi:hypothetical protein
LVYICCAGAVSEYFQSSEFENIFSKRNSVEAHAVGFWDYHSFITASAYYQPYGFGTTYINGTFFGTKEVAAFLAHVGTKMKDTFLPNFGQKLSLEKTILRNIKILVRKCLSKRRFSHLKVSFTKTILNESIFQINITRVMFGPKKKKKKYVFSNFGPRQPIGKKKILTKKIVFIK